MHYRVMTNNVRLTQHSHGGGCACKIPPGALEDLLSAIPDRQGTSGYASKLIVGLDDGDDAAVVAVDDGRNLVTTLDFFPPVVDDAFDWGRIAAANALSDIYAMGGVPIVALNILGWPVEKLPMELAAEVLRGGFTITAEAGCHLAGGHSIDDPEPKYGLAVTGTVDGGALMQNSCAQAGQALSITKPLGVGVLNSRHKATGEVFPEAISSMAALNRDASVEAVQAGIKAATDVTGFGLLGHVYKMARASRVSVVIDSAAIPYLERARESAERGFVSGGTRRNLKWVAPHMDTTTVQSMEQILMADAQTSGGLLLAGEIDAGTIIGEFVEAEEKVIILK
ncbi:MAG: selenide, water dikinase SelD [Candidatus Methylomirabilaceae bacterium]